jgi:hypothetical protein
MAATKNQLRCFCSRRPLLAMYGLDAKGRTYVHCRVFKQNRVYGDWIVYDGEVRLACRECLRWHVITFIPNSRAAVLQESSIPAEVDIGRIVGSDHQRIEADDG